MHAHPFHTCRAVAAVPDAQCDIRVTRYPASGELKHITGFLVLHNMLLRHSIVLACQVLGINPQGSRVPRALSAKGQPDRLVM